MTEPLAIKYRPKTFDEFFGGREIKESILKGLGTTHVYLMHGKMGCGKTTLARLVARELEVDEFEIHEIDAASNRTIDDARRLKSAICRRPMAGDRKIYIIDECQGLLALTQDALLKTLEEPPDYVYFVLCTTEFGKVVPTIRSRAKAGTYEVKPLSRREMHGLLSRVCTEEGIDLDRDVYNALVGGGEGIPRDTLGLLDKVCGMAAKDALVLISAGGIDDHNVLELCRTLLDHKKDKWKRCREILQGITEEPETVRRGVLGYMTKVMVGEDNPKAAAVISDEFLDNFFASGKAGLILAAYRSCLILEKKIKP